ncbi:hypothetical protein AB0L14_17785 [Streptomyces sp. NPDC052727]
MAELSGDGIYETQARLGDPHTGLSPDTRTCTADTPAAVTTPRHRCPEPA